MKPGAILLVAATAGAALVPFLVRSGASPEGSRPEPERADERPAAQASPESQPALLSGTVEEVIQVPGYTYLGIASGGARRWAAVSTAELERGSVVSVHIDTTLDNFKSTTLDRTFDTIVFGRLDAGAAPASPRMGSVAPGSETADLRAPDNDGAKAISVSELPKAEGGHRIAELYAARHELQGKTVRVRGVVTKSLAGIMNKTFVHLADGSGSPESKDDDLTVTMLETPKQGALVVVEGTLILDKDLGAGYRYDLMVEEAKLVAE